MKKTIIRRTHLEAIYKQHKALHPLLRRVYSSRGIETFDKLERGLDKLIPYGQLKGINEAVMLLVDALKNQYRILIIGDFDADGATSTALAVSALRQFGMKSVDYLVPNRFEFGYGLTPEIVLLAAERKPDLLITVDNGITSIEGVEKAHSLGIKVLITDHHLAGEMIPNADAIVNPNQPGCEFPSKCLAGVGVIFYVMLALRGFLREQDWFKEQRSKEPNMAQLLDLVALGTVADVVPLDHNNRILVHQGIQRIRRGKARQGIQALIQIARRNPSMIVASDLGFAVGPRLNAAGRLDDMSLGIDCLLSTNAEQAKRKAQELDQLNEDRKMIEEEMKIQALEELKKLSFDENTLPIGLCLYDENWHQGVIGILASRIKDRFNRPVCAFAPADEQTLKASIRSIKGLHIRDILANIEAQHPMLMTKFGGHAMAAGLSLKKENFSLFTEIFDREVKKYIRDEDLVSCIETDGELSVNELKLEMAEMLREAGPWGQDFPEPLFDGKFILLDQQLVGSRHLRMSLTLPHERAVFSAIAFNIDLKQWPNFECEEVHLVYRLDVNEYNGNRSLQLVVEYMESMSDCSLLSLSASSPPFPSSSPSFPSSSPSFPRKRESPPTTPKKEYIE